MGGHRRVPHRRARRDRRARRFVPRAGLAHDLGRRRTRACWSHRVTDHEATIPSDTVCLTTLPTDSATTTWDGAGSAVPIAENAAGIWDGPGPGAPV